LHPGLLEGTVLNARKLPVPSMGERKKKVQKGALILFVYSADFDSAVRLLPPGPSTWTTGGAAEHYDRATNTHFQPVKPQSATGKSLIFLDPRLSLNQRVPGSSPGAPTKQIKHLARETV
jgi:hypothetical protein